MARLARKESSTGYYHIILRGINRSYIFNGQEEKLQFMKWVKEQEKAGYIEIVSWCLMDNHVHLVLKGSLTKLSEAVKIVSIKYASYYNKRNKRIGSVFGERYKSEVIEDDTYLLEVIRYVHNNPVKAKLVEKVQDYKWSSCQEYLTKGSFVNAEQKRFVMEYFENRPEKFLDYQLQENHKEFLEIKEDKEKQRIEKCQRLIGENKRVRLAKLR